MFIKIACPFFDGFDKEDVLQCLSDKNLPNANPIWLNNNGQNFIALLPTTTFSVFFSNTPQLFTLKIKDKNNHQQTQTVNVEQLTVILENFYQQQSTNLTLAKSSDKTNLSINVDYQNGLIGFVSYDFSAFCLADLQTISHHPIGTQTPCAYFAHYPYFLQKQHNGWQLISYAKNHDELMVIYQQLQSLSENKKNYQQNQPISKLTLTPQWQFADYEKAFNKVQDYLYAGDCYQINLTQCWQGVANEPLLNFLPKLTTASIAPFSGYLNIENYEIVSCSPELFFTFIKHNDEINLITKPIKGTRPRHHDKNIDEKLKNELKISEKDTAENVMIVDLLRNDLGKYAKTGTVKVPKLFAIESFSNVHHMVSTITATLKDTVSPMAVLLGSLPAGSITGTPKKRSVEIIHELESDNRGAYCGTLGFVNFDGTGQFNVLIRTLQAKKTAHTDYQVSLWAGGGVTVASNCQDEYQECFDKINHLLGLLQR